MFHSWGMRLRLPELLAEHDVTAYTLAQPASTAIVTRPLLVSVFKNATVATSASRWLRLYCLASLRMTWRTLIPANENMLLELGHTDKCTGVGKNRWAPTV